MTDDNRPYYGRDRRESRDRRLDRNTDRRRAQALLPHPSVLEQYEEISPGAAGRIVHMAEKEMQHRHAWEDRYLHSYIGLYRLGQICGLLIALLTVLTSFYLFLAKEVTGAMVVAASGVGMLVAASIASSIRRRFENRPRRRK